MYYDSLSGIPSDYEVIWQGIVKVDLSVLQHISSQTSEKGGIKLFVIRDSKYGYEDNAQLDNIKDQGDFPNKVVLFVKNGEILEYMDCLGIKYYSYSESKGFIKKGSRGKKTIYKGFILQPILGEDIIKSYACLASIQFDNEQGRLLTVHKKGLFVFTSGSQSSKITLRDPHKSVTIVFVATDDNPFIASVQTKNKSLKFICDSKGIKSEETTYSFRSSLSSYENEDPIQTLKLRLSKGEITIEEYQKLKKIIEDDRLNSSSYWI